MPSTKAQNEWIKANRIHKTINLSKISDQDIIDRLEKQPSVQGYIKRLIREDIRRSEGATR